MVLSHRHRSDGGKNPILSAALALARAGLYIFLSPKKNGAARIRWREGSTRDEATIIKWWSQWPDDLICLDCGKSEIGVIDVDTLEGHDVDGESALFDAQMANDFLPETLRAETPSKGKHYFFRDPGSLLKTTTGKIGPGIDTRGRGGMVVLAPSVAKGKGVYRWLNEFEFRDLPTIPQWVLDKCGKPNNLEPVPDAEFEPVYTEEEFAERLNLLDVDDFRDHDKWLRLMLACTHSSTVLDGREAFMKWTTGNFEGEYAGDYDLISERWDYNYRYNRNKSGNAAKVGTFNKFLEDAGQGHKVKCQPKIDARDEFTDDDVMIPPPMTPEEKAGREKAEKEAAERAARRAERDRLRRIRAIRIVRSLLDKTVANGCTEEEAAASYAKAVELIEQYNLTAEELTADLPPNSAEEEEAAEFTDVPTGATVNDFYHHGPTNTFIYCKTNDMWPSGSINGRFGKGSSIGIARTKSVEQATWAPGLPMVVRDKLISNGRWIDEPGAAVYNLYKPPLIEGKGDPEQAGPWLDHLKKIYPEDWQHILGWFAWRVQRPDVKINHCLVFGGDPGIGKDTLIAGLRHAVGPWNCGECNPPNLFEDYTASFFQRVILRVNEARDMGDSNISRYDFYEGTKTFMASPPETLTVMEKYLKRYDIMNLVGLIITTNNKTNGLYLPPDDRRYYVAWSPLKESDFEAGYFSKLWDWYESGGFDHVAAYLRADGLSPFDPKATPPKTPAFWEIVGANRAPEESELAALLAIMGDPIGLNDPGTVTLPQAITVAQVTAAAARLGEFDELWSWLTDPGNRRQLPGRFEKVGYAMTRNPDDQRDGQWAVAGKRQTVYTLKHLSGREQFKAVAELRQQAEEQAARVKSTHAKANNG
jgi:Bifunctional DNA primase/polymerase, N-terminal